MAAHLYRPIADGQGNLRLDSVVTLYAEGTPDPTTTPFFSDEALTLPMTNPFDCPSGIIDVYFAAPIRVDVGVAPPGEAEVVIHGIDTTSDTLVLTDSAGVRWQVTVDTSGNLVTTALS